MNTLLAAAAISFVTPEQITPVAPLLLRVARTCVRQVLMSACISKKQRQRAEEKLLTLDDADAVMQWHEALKKYVSMHRHDSVAVAAPHGQQLSLF